MVAKSTNTSLSFLADTMGSPGTEDGRCSESRSGFELNLRNLAACDLELFDPFIPVAIGRVHFDAILILLPQYSKLPHHRVKVIRNGVTGLKDSAIIVHDVHRKGQIIQLGLVKSTGGIAIGDCSDYKFVLMAQPEVFRVKFERPEENKCDEVEIELL